MAKIPGKYIDGGIFAQEFGTGNGSSSGFGLSATPINSNGVAVFVDGILQRPGASFDYTISGSTITFNTAPANGQEIGVFYFKQ